jgi:hypothetical protein
VTDAAATERPGFSGNSSLPEGAGDGGARKSTRAGRWKFFAILAISVAPVLASYLMYYVVKPEGRTNYGELLDPQRPVEGLTVQPAAGGQADLAVHRGKWVMLSIDGEGCRQACADKLYVIRQVRLTAGKERDRVERVLLLTDDTPLDPALQREHEGLVVHRLATSALERWFPVEQGGRPEDHVYLIDPLGNVMMRFPKSADPNRMKKDLAKLLRASRVG